MTTLSQERRTLRITTPLGDDRLVLTAIHGREAVSEPFRFRLTVCSTDDDIDAQKLLREPVAVGVRLPDGSIRHLHGRCARFAWASHQGEFANYELDLVPWFWFLGLSRDCRIFQNLSVLEIVTQVFDGLGESDYDIRCLKSYPKREFCVQYRETNLAFVSRLLEEEGIHYFVEHAKNRHVLVLADTSTSAEPLPGTGPVRVNPAGPQGIEEDVVSAFVGGEAATTTKVVLTDYNYLNPTLNLKAELSAASTHEAYDYPGGYVERAEGDRYARLRLEAEESLAEVGVGEGFVRALQPGYLMELRDHHRRRYNRSWFVLDVEHDAAEGPPRSGEPAGEARYENRFRVIPSSTPYRPPLRTPRPLVAGAQTAVVVGKKGEEIWTDSHGRVKVHFHWDRLGGRDENSSCWVRVASTWAGRQWGAISLPRIGQEVIVEFLEGDPDLPIITGRVYNADQMPPYPLPAEQTRSGVKSRSSKGGGEGDFNEIRFEDKKGQEELHIHAERNEHHVVEANRDDEVGANETRSVGKNRSRTVGENESVTVGKDRTVTVGTNLGHTVGANDTMEVGAAQSITVGASRSATIGANDALTVGEDYTVAVGKKQAVTVGDGRTTSVGRDDALTVGKKLVVSAGDEIVLTTGRASIILKKDGTVQIKGKDVTISASGKLNAKASGDLVMKGAKIGQN